MNWAEGSECEATSTETVLVLPFCTEKLSALLKNNEDNYFILIIAWCKTLLLFQA